MPEFMSPGLMWGGAIGQGLMAGVDAFDKARQRKLEEERFQTDKRAREGLLKLKAAEEGMTYDPNSGELTKLPGASPSQSRKSLAGRIQMFKAMPEDWRMGTQEGQDEYNFILKSLRGGAAPEPGAFGTEEVAAPAEGAESFDMSAPSREPQGLMNRQPQGMVDRNPAWTQLKGYKTKAQRELETAAIKKRNEKRIEQEMDKEAVQDPMQVYSKMTAEGRNKIGLLNQAMSATKDYRKAYGSGFRPHSILDPESKIPIPFTGGKGIPIGRMFSTTTPLDVARQQYVEAIGRLNSQGQIKDEEMENFASMLPIAGDTEAMGWAKLDKVDQMLGERLQAFGIPNLESVGLSAKETPGLLEAGYGLRKPEWMPQEEWDVLSPENKKRFTGMKEPPVASGK